jgi:hypothetical protein
MFLQIVLCGRCRRPRRLRGIAQVLG